MRDVFARVYQMLVCGICLLAIGSVGLYAQGSASISGKVLDPDSKVVVNAAVIVRNESTNAIRTVATDAVGNGDRTTEIACVRITEAGWRALEGPTDME